MSVASQERLRIRKGNYAFSPWTTTNLTHIFFIGLEIPLTPLNMLLLSSWSIVWWKTISFLDNIRNFIIFTLFFVNVDHFIMRNQVYKFSTSKNMRFRKVKSMAVFLKSSTKGLGEKNVNFFCAFVIFTQLIFLVTWRLTLAVELTNNVRLVLFFVGNKSCIFCVFIEKWNINEFIVQL